MHTTIGRSRHQVGDGRHIRRQVSEKPGPDDGPREATGLAWRRAPCDDGYDSTLVVAELTPGSATREQALVAFRADGCGASRSWANGPGDRYARHQHDEHKVLFCLGGSIVFHTVEGDLELTEGDRLDLPAGTSHAATVGHEGCECVEAYRDGPRERSREGENRERPTR